MTKAFDSAVMGSDLPRSRRQYLLRKASELLVRAAGLNGSSRFSTEIVQAIHPVAHIATAHGTFECRTGHGRLVWRAETFHTEEPETVKWLDTIEEGDTLWDVGANVGLYSIYAARFRKCHVVAFEPESQNYALLVENIALNGVGDRCTPACVAVAGRSGPGYLEVRYVTKGGAFNLFTPNRAADGETPESIKTIRQAKEQPRVRQLVVGSSLDDLVLQHGLAAPTHLKIDVDGIEPEIIDGAPRLLAKHALRSILIEINKKSPRDMGIPEILAGHGFRLVSERSNWLSRADRTMEHEMPAVNMIFSR